MTPRGFNYAPVSIYIYIEREKERQTETDRDRQRQTETDREREREREIRKERKKEVRQNEPPPSGLFFLKNASHWGNVKHVKNVKGLTHKKCA